MWEGRYFKNKSQSSTYGNYAEHTCFFQDSFHCLADDCGAAGSSVGVSFWAKGEEEGAGLDNLRFVM